MVRDYLMDQFNIYMGELKDYFMMDMVILILEDLETGLCLR